MATENSLTPLITYVYENYTTDVVDNDVPTITPSSPPADLDMVRENPDIHYSTQQELASFEVDPLNKVGISLEDCPTRYQQDRTELTDLQNAIRADEAINQSSATETPPTE